MNSQDLVIVKQGVKVDWMSKEAYIIMPKDL